ncbi:hypothetical protein FI667_g2272, partial [Globisporangium splendens]
MTLKSSVHSILSLQASILLPIARDEEDAAGRKWHERLIRSVKFVDFLMCNTMGEAIARNARQTRAQVASMSGHTEGASRQGGYVSPTEAGVAQDLVSMFLESNSLTESSDIDAQAIRDMVKCFISIGADPNELTYEVGLAASVKGLLMVSISSTDARKRAESSRQEERRII